MREEWDSQSWDAIIFHPTLKDGRGNCRLKVDRGQYLVGEMANQKDFSLDLNQIQVSLGGVSKDLVYFKPMIEGHGPTFAVRDMSILKSLKDLGYPDLLQGIGQVRKGILHKRGLFLGVLVALLLFLFFGIPVLTFYGVEMVVKAIPTSLDQKLGDTAFSSMNLAPCKDPIVIDAVEKIVHRLSSQLKGSPYQYRVQVVESETLNAFALPGGQMVVFTGLLKKAKGPDEVAGVLAHEIIHVQKRHGVKQLVRSIGAWIILQILFGDVTGASGLIVDNAESLIGLKFGRDMEREADVLGFELMEKAQLDPSGLKQFFETVQLFEKTSPAAILSTHPLTQERIQYMDNRLKKIDSSHSQKPLDIDWTEVQNALNKK